VTVFPFVNDHLIFRIFLCFGVLQKNAQGFLIQPGKNRNALEQGNHD